MKFADATNIHSDDVKQREYRWNLDLEVLMICHRARQEQKKVLEEQTSGSAELLETNVADKRSMEVAESDRQGK